MSPLQAKLERFSAGERFAVDPDAIERELSALWRAAGSSTATTTPVTRACLWNVVVHLEGRPRGEGASDAGRLEQMIRELPRHLAARALVLRTLSAEEPAQPSGRRENAPELESWISANCILASGGGKLVCSEEVALAARGEGIEHLPALVRALLVPQVPSAVVFAGVPPPNDGIFSELMDSADRLVVHADRSSQATPLATIRDLMTRVPLGAIDLGWLELAPIRGLVANLFDPPTPDDAAGAIDRVTISVGPRYRWSAHLLLGWIASVLSAETPRAIGQGAWRFPRLGRRPLDGIVREDPAVPMATVELSTATGATYAVHPSCETMAEVSGPRISAKKPIGCAGATELLARSLATRSEDRAFARAVWLAGAMS